MQDRVKCMGLDLIIIVPYACFSFNRQMFSFIQETALLNFVSVFLAFWDGGRVHAPAFPSV